MSKVNVENEIVMRPINTVRPYVRNPRKNAKTVELLCKVIPKVGFNVPIVIDEKGIIVKGHARFSAAIKLGMTEVPCIITHADEEAVKADRIADNKISEFSEWISDDLFAEVDSIDFDMSDLGLPKVSLDDVPTPEAIEDDLESTVPAPAPVSEEKKQELYEGFKKGVDDPALEKAIEEFGEEPYYKCVCDKCGHVTFIKESEIE